MKSSIHPQKKEKQNIGTHGSIVGCKKRLMYANKLKLKEQIITHVEI